MLNLNCLDVLHNGKSLVGSLFGGLKPKSDIPILLKRYMDKVLSSISCPQTHCKISNNYVKIVVTKQVFVPSFVLKFFSNFYQELMLDEFVTHEVEFNDINKAFDLLIKGESLRCVIWMNK